MSVIPSLFFCIGSGPHEKMGIEIGKQIIRENGEGDALFLNVYLLYRQKETALFGLDVCMCV